jgi:hypothetical protein
MGLPGCHGFDLPQSQPIEALVVLIETAVLPDVAQEGADKSAAMSR